MTASWCRPSACWRSRSWCSSSTFRSALTLPLAIRSLPRGATHPDVKLDIGGVWLVGLALVAIIYPLIQGQTDGWPAWCFAALAAGAALLVAFLFHERRRQDDALIEPSLLTNRTYLSGIAVMLGLFGAFGGLLLLAVQRGRYRRLPVLRSRRDTARTP